MAQTITAETPNIRGVKDSSRNYINVLRNMTKDEKTDLRKRLDALGVL